MNMSYLEEVSSGPDDDFEAPLSESDSSSDSGTPPGEDEWEVASIVGHRYTILGKEEYKIHWRGWPSSSDSWEPKDDVSAPDCVEAFWRREFTKKREFVPGDDGLPPELGPKYDWHIKVTSITSLTADGTHAHVRWADGTASIEEVALLFERCPLKAMRFYESQMGEY
ncbi:hypothetical protein BDK51DRAFT_33504 [Blyttiomyces helicus]|uniref:Chromo domain-containing protein n=1 Tax=Blyttiomyces helicus TaxID=388810 RepID=A0A4P9W4S6_9FUNG|nr:hypothetical protein BDK51DRAFT_33504 [Blyttiomyces helicus]|eukprot:RKO85720.1 hypothetical protein BDK51DRAFT_33504 [Blyttiomyces helicus]